MGGQRFHGLKRRCVCRAGSQADAERARSADSRLDQPLGIARTLGSGSPKLGFKLAGSQRAWPPDRDHRAAHLSSTHRPTPQRMRVIGECPPGRRDDRARVEIEQFELRIRGPETSSSQTARSPSPSPVPSSRFLSHPRPKPKRGAILRRALTNARSSGGANVASASCRVLVVRVRVRLDVDTDGGPPIASTQAVGVREAELRAGTVGGCPYRSQAAPRRIAPRYPPNTSRIAP